jgi:hypothetical protein
MPSKAVRRTFRGIEGIDFVRCRICGDRRRVISARHLSKHDIDRETYLEEYELSPDDLIAKDFRRIQSSRRDFRATASASGSRQRGRLVSTPLKSSRPGISKRNFHSSTAMGRGSSVAGTTRCGQPDSTRIACGSESRGVKNR